MKLSTRIALLVVLGCTACDGGETASQLTQQLIAGQTSMVSMRLVDPSRAIDLDGDGDGDDRLGSVLAGLFPDARRSERPLLSAAMYEATEPAMMDAELAIGFELGLPPLPIRARIVSVVMDMQRGDDVYGRFAALVPSDQLETTFLPALAAILGPLGDGADGAERARSLRMTFDEYAPPPLGGDDHIEPSEVRDQPLLRALLGTEVVVGAEHGVSLTVEFRARPRR